MKDNCFLEGVYIRPEVKYNQNEISFCHEKNPGEMKLHFRVVF